MCRSMPKTTDNVTVVTKYNFEAPINQAEEEDDEDLEVSEEITREIEWKADNIQPYQEAIKTINMSTWEDPEETKLRGNVRADP